MNFNVEQCSHDPELLETKMGEIFDFINANLGFEFTIEHPAVFYNGWASDKIKVFSSRDGEGKLTALALVGLFKCPVMADKNHRVDFYIKTANDAGMVDFSHMVDVALKAGGLL